ncbi:MAG: hypothetical protein ACJ8AO_20290 [Gemmatimonadaceae bacterium]
MILHSIAALEELISQGRVGHGHWVVVPSALAASLTTRARRLLAARLRDCGAACVISRLGVAIVILRHGEYADGLVEEGQAEPL